MLNIILDTIDISPISRHKKTRHFNPCFEAIFGSKSKGKKLRRKRSYFILKEKYIFIYIYILKIMLHFIVDEKIKVKNKKLFLLYLFLKIIFKLNNKKYCFSIL